MGPTRQKSVIDLILILYLFGKLLVGTYRFFCTTSVIKLTPCDVEIVYIIYSFHLFVRFIVLIKLLTRSHTNHPVGIIVNKLLGGSHILFVGRCTIFVMLGVAGIATDIEAIASLVISYRMSSSLRLPEYFGSYSSE